MVPAGNKAKRLSSVNHTTKTIHHHLHHHHVNKNFSQDVSVSNNILSDYIPYETTFCNEEGPQWITKNKMKLIHNDSNFDL